MNSGGMSDPDYIYDPDDWECTHEYEDRDLLTDDLWAPPNIKKFKTLVHGPDRFAAYVPTDWNDEGNPDGGEWQWFDTESAAEAAIASAKQ